MDWAKFADFQKEQMRELMTNYGPIDIAWFDIRWPYVSREIDGIHHRINNPQVKEDMLEIVQMMRKINPEMIINDRGVHDWGNFATPEQKIPKVDSGRLLGDKYDNI